MDIFSPEFQHAIDVNDALQMVAWQLDKLVSLDVITPEHAAQLLVTLPPLVDVPDVE